MKKLDNLISHNTLNVASSIAIGFGEYGEKRVLTKNQRIFIQLWLNIANLLYLNDYEDIKKAMITINEYADKVIEEWK